MKRFIPYLLIFSLLFCSPATAQNSPGDFADTKGHWAEQEITACAELDLMNGIGLSPAGTNLFAPDAPVSHAQLAVVLQQTFQLDYGDKRFIKQPLATDYFSDVSDHDWYSNALVMCAINQVFEGNTQFVPAGPIQRIELAQAIYRSFQAKKISIPMILSMPIFKDTQGLSQEESNAMVFVNNTGIMTGNKDAFRPSDPVKRCELARVLNRCLELMSIHEAENAQEIKLRPGQSFCLSLDSNPTTGYTWMLSGKYDQQTLSCTGQTYIAQDSKPNIVGQGGRQLFRFKALQEGTTELHLNYARPWESVMPQKTFQLKIRVAY